MGPRDREFARAGHGTDGRRSRRGRFSDERQDEPFFGNDESPGIFRANILSSAANPGGPSCSVGKESAAGFQTEDLGRFSDR